MLCCASASVNALAIQDIQIDHPRSFGYVIGDTFTHTVNLTLNKPYRLQQDLLPTSGRITHWLQRFPAQVTEHDTATTLRYVIALTYQVINVDAIAQTLSTPEEKLSFSDGQGTLTALIPAWRFRLNRLTDHELPASHIRANHPPLPLPNAATLLWLAGLGLTLALAGLAYLHWTIPFSRRHNGPFAQACKQLHQIPSAVEKDTDSYLTALRTVHNAFNRTLGETVFAENLDHFFAQCPHFQHQRQPIERYFAHSQQVFFTDQPEGSSYTIAALLALCQRCRDIERRLS